MSEKANEIITLDSYFTDYITKKDRRKVYKKEFKPEYQDNAVKLLEKVNVFLIEIGITTANVTSGWRPASLNQNTPNAAKKSGHMIGLCVDILDDKDQTLAKLVASRPDLLRKYDLFMENLQNTRGKNTNWVHLDILVRADRPSRVFNP